MGVHGLWELLSPVGHRVSNDSVRNKVLAVDVSIWITQFVKAMRDTEGAQLRNSHLLGIFRRCVKLLYLSVKPVLVFDGATPALKRRTLSSRRAQREKHEAKLRRLAEKMLLNRIRRRTLGSVIAKRRKRHDLKKVEPMSSKTTSHRQEAMLLQRPSDTVTETEQTAASVSDREMSPDLPYEGSDLDDVDVSIPQNVNDLDDEVLMNLPTKLQAEVFKQVKLDQRARHRENMTQKRQDPTEFSKMQIEGFLRHTALIRKISRVRKVSNSKSGATQRIASDSGRNFVLEEHALTGTLHGTEACGSYMECLDSRSLKEDGTVDNSDLLASIRKRKETVQCGAVVTRTKHLGKLVGDPPYRESGTDWASKVLEGNGSLVLRTGIPGDSPTAGESKLSSHSDDDSELLLDEHKRLPTKITEDPRAKDVTLGKEEVGTDTSDDEEWEDGNQPIENDLGRVVCANPRRSDNELSKLSDISKSEAYPKVMGSLSQKPSEGMGERDFRVSDIEQYLERARRASPDNDIDGKKPFRKNQGTPNGASHKNAGDCQRSESFLIGTLESNTGPEQPKTLCFGDSKHVEGKEGKFRSLTEERYDGGNAGELQRTKEFEPRNDSTNSKLPQDEVQLEAIGNSHRCLTKEQNVSFIGPEDIINPRQRNGVGNATSSEKEDEKPSHSTSRKNSEVTDVDMSSLSAPSVLNVCQPRNGFKVGVAEANVQTMSSARCLESEPSPTRGRSDSHEMRIVDIREDEESGKKVSTAGPNVASSGFLRRREESLSNRDTTRETPSDRERVEQHSVESSLPAQTEEQEQEPSLAHLESMQEDLEVEAREISRQRSLHRGGADTVAEEMYEETRDLIKLFGIPYLEAPMEAEAQCAFLNKEKLVDGVLTEDSDAFLFGAITVYRQLFAEGRFAEAYHADDIQQSLGLSRDNLIRLAYLLGSDYTAGVRGVGIVNSMEILEAFPGSSGLEEFRDWTKSVTILDEEPEEEVMIGKMQEAVRRRFCWKHRNMKRNWEVREGFPNPAVFDAYINPVIDNCRKRFSWGPVDFEGLAKFCWEKFGWERDRFESVVGPLRQQLKEGSGRTQKRIDEFFKPHRFARIRSERLQSAVHGMVGDAAEELMSTNCIGARKRKVSSVTYGTELSDRSEDESRVDTKRNRQ